MNKFTNIRNFQYFGISLLVISFLLTSFLYNKKEVSNIPSCAIENNSFKGGEQLVYKAYYNWKFVWVPAGEAVFNVSESKDFYEIKVTGRTYDSYDYFFRVRDYFYSKIDKKTMLPINFVRIVEEGNYRKYDSLVFDQVKQRATSFNGKTKATAKRKEIPLNECMHDLLSVLYFMRNIDVAAYKVGDNIPVKMLFDEKIYPIKVRYEGKESKFEVKELGTFNTVKVIPDLISGSVFKENDKMKVWVSDDENKIPLLIESPLKVGYAKAVLKSYSGNRYKLTSKVK